MKLKLKNNQKNVEKALNKYEEAYAEYRAYERTKEDVLEMPNITPEEEERIYLDLDEVYDEIVGNPKRELFRAENNLIKSFYGVVERMKKELGEYYNFYMNLKEKIQENVVVRDELIGRILDFQI